MRAVSLDSLKMAAMAGKIKTVDGVPLTADKFAYVGDPQDIETWHLPLDTHQHVNSALDMFAHTDLPSSAKAPTARKIVAKAREENLDTTDFVKNHLSSQMHGEAPRPWFEIFRAGDYTKAGKGVITPDDLKRVVRNYDPTYHEAPETLGHRSDDQPAYGWLDGLMVDGDKLLARERQVDPKFDEARKAGKFKKRSAAFYTDENGQVTGLRHLAWLGAGIPEVKGLADVAFDDHGSKFITVDFGEEEAVDKPIKEQLAEFFAEMFGGKKTAAEKTFGEDEVKRIATEAATAAAAPLQAEIATLKAQSVKFAEREAALAGGEVKQRATAAVARLKTAGKWVPAFEKMGLGLVFDELAKVETTVEFGEGDAKKTITPLETLVLFLEGLPKIVSGGRVFEGGKPMPGKAGTGDPLTDAAKAYEKEHKISFSEALDKVSAEHPEWTGAGVATGGAV
jgi:hypothetical protein